MTISVVNESSTKKEVYSLCILLLGLFICLCVSAPNVAPSDVGGGGGSNRELTITWAVSLNPLHVLNSALPIYFISTLFCFLN